MSETKFFTDFPDPKAYEKRMILEKKQARTIQEERDRLEGEKTVPQTTMFYFYPHSCNSNCNSKCADEKRDLRERIYITDETKRQSLQVEFKDTLYDVQVPETKNVADIIKVLLSLVGETIPEPKLLLGDTRLCQHDQFIPYRRCFSLFLRLRGGGYSSHHLKCLDPLERLDVQYLHGARESYHVIPETWTQVSKPELPKRSTYNFVLLPPYSKRIEQAIQKYTGQDFFALNLRLNLLNKVAPHDSEFFCDLMQVCLGSYQMGLPQVVYRYTHLTDDERDFYRARVGSLILYKQFLSTSTCSTATKHLGPHRFKIVLKPGHRNGAFYIGKSSEYPAELEVLLCAYSLFRIVHVTETEIIMEYNDYYEFLAKKKE